MYYVAKLTPEESGGYSVTFPDVPGCITQGDTEEDALKNAKEALELTLECDMDNNWEVPMPETGEDTENGLHIVYVDEALSRKIRDRYTSRAMGMLAELDKKGFFR